MVVSTVVFGMVHMIPGDPIDFMIGENAALADKQDLRRSYHLDKPALLNTRPWTKPHRVEALLRESGDRSPGGRPPSAAEAEAWEALIDLGRWAVPTLKELKEAGGGLAGPAEVTLAEIARIDPGSASHVPTTKARLRSLFLETQYARFFADLAAGELRSLHSNEPVVTALKTRFGYTMKLAGCALLVAMLVSIPIGTVAAWRQYSWVDNVSMLGALVGISMPNFWLGPLLIIAFSIELGWFPVSGADSPGSIVLPAITLGLGMSAILTRITRSSVLDTVKEDYIRTAYAKGLPPRTVLIKHALRTALIPVVTILGLQFGALLAGSIITEEIFGWPGLGRGIIHAISERDFPMIQGCVLLIAVTYVAVNTITDLVYTLVNPRVRLD
jgi:ABC-type dipeptide/oligopeptide/nickel transport system permease component